MYHYFDFRKHREQLFAREFAERETEDILDRVLLKARNAKELGSLPAPEFYRNSEKITALKKLKFVEEFEYFQDKEAYEWMKYKVAAEIGGQEEQEAYSLYEKVKLDELGEIKYRLMREKVHDPAMSSFV